MAACLVAGPTASGQSTFTWDPNGGTSGPQDGAGTWNSSNTNWWNGSSNVAWTAGSIAAFGSGGTPGTVTVSGSVNAGGLSFGSLGSGTYTLASGTIGMTSAATISLSRSAVINSILSGSSLSISNASGTNAFQFGANNSLTGTLSLRSASVGTGLTVNISSNSIVPGVFGSSTVDIGNNVTLLFPTSDFNVSNAFVIAGTGTGGAGAIRFQGGAGTGRTFSGPITLAGDASIISNSSVSVWFTGGFHETAGGAKSLALNANSAAYYLQGQSTYTGTTSVLQGTVVLEGGDDRLSPSSVLNVGAGSFATLVVGGTSGAINQTVAGYVGVVGRPDRSRIVGGASGTSTLTFAIASGTSTFIGFIGGTGNGNNLAITKSGAGVLVLSNTAATYGGVHTYTGTTSVTGGMLVMGGTSILPNTPIDIGAAGTFVLGGTGTASYPIVSLAGSGSMRLGVNTLRVGSNNASTTFAGVISGSSSAGLVKVGSGTLELAGANAYPGATAINGGQLRVTAGSINSTSGITIDGGGLRYDSDTALTAPLSFSGSGGTLSGTGTINTAVTVGTNATIAPGNSPGIQPYVAGLTWAPGGTYQWELNAMSGTPGTNWDLVDVTAGSFSLSSLSVGNTFQLDLTTLTGGNSAGTLDNPYVPGVSSSFLIADFGGATLSVPGGFFTTAGSDLTPLFSFNLANWQVIEGGVKPSVSDMSVRVNSLGTGLELVIVPEPTSFALMGVGVAMVSWWSARRRLRAS